MLRVLSPLTGCLIDGGGGQGLPRVAPCPDQAQDEDRREWAQATCRTKGRPDGVPSPPRRGDLPSTCRRRGGDVGGEGTAGPWPRASVPCTSPGLEVRAAFLFFDGNRLVHVDGDGVAITDARGRRARARCC